MSIRSALLEMLTRQLGGGAARAETQAAEAPTLRQALQERFPDFGEAPRPAAAPQASSGTRDASAAQQYLNHLREQGFDVDTPLYHGRSSDFAELRPGRKGGAIYLTDRPEIADIYAQAAQRRWPGADNAGPNTMPVFVRRQNPLIVSDVGPNGDHGWFSDNFAEALGAPADMPRKQLYALAAERGYDTIEVRNMLDLGGEQTQYLVLNPDNIRSRFGSVQSPDARASSAPTLRGYHGSNVEGITELRPGERGPMGPATYLSPNNGVAGRYGEHIYEADAPDIFHGLGSSGFADSSINPYEVWRTQLAQLMDAASPEMRPQIAAIAERMHPQDGYPFFRRLANLYGSDEAAQGLFKRAGFRGISGHVDGPEIAIFGNVRPSRAQSDGNDARKMLALLLAGGGMGGVTLQQALRERMGA